jgi:hypothetical protein
MLIRAQAYVSKMVKVNSEGDCWSLISLGNARGNKNVELKFVDSMRRPFEFSVDSFQIKLETLLFFYKCSELPISEDFYPTVVGESVYGNYEEAFQHLQKKLIATRNPEEIRGGGLLKYCHLLVRKYRPAFPDKIKTLERYMCSRFFIDFPDVNQQKNKLENYLWNHFIESEEEGLKYQYLLLLRNVVDDSTVCLMGHERRQTLALIEDMTFQVLCVYSGQQQKYLHSPTAYMYSNGYYYTPMISPCSSCNSYLMASNSNSRHSSSSASSSSSSSASVRYPPSSSPSSSASSVKSSISSSSPTTLSSPPSASSTPPLPAA